MIHANYDSISAAMKMDEAWSALQYAGYSPKRPAAGFVQQFNDALVLEEGNITELGEKGIATRIRTQWDAAKSKIGKVSASEFSVMRGALEELVLLNERGMFNLARSSDIMSERVLIGSVIYFIISLILSIFFADQLAQRLSRPIKSIAEALHRRPSITGRLKLPDPTNLEMLILTTELRRLWERLSATEKVNVAEIVQQKSKLETLLESVDDGLLVVNAQGRISHCNECLAKLVGLPSKEIQGQIWTDLPISNENYMKLRAALREDMAEALQIELVWNGQPSFFSARLRKILGVTGSDGVLYLLHDITEKKQRDKFRSEFIDLLSHELKNPLQSLGTASELLTVKRMDLPVDLRDLVDTISEDVERIKGVAHEFVQVTQSQSKIMKLKLEMVAINQLLPEWLKSYMLIAKDRDVKLEFQQEGSEVIWASLDLVKFPWVISNLVSNAIRFSPPAGVVTVMLTDRNNAVEIQVRDEGPGVPEAEQTRIFEPFFQGTIKSSPGARGLFGVGLTIAKEVVEAHDGRIEYRRGKTKGSEFRILLPFPPFNYQSDADLVSRRST